MNNPKEGDVQVWWIPQIPMTAFIANVSTIEEGWRICDVLAFYDLFQLKHHVKPDYSNAGGVRILENGDWTDVEENDWKEDTGYETLTFSEEGDP
jgi:hypothetical protein